MNSIRLDLYYAYDSLGLSSLIAIGKWYMSIHGYVNSVLICVQVCIWACVLKSNLNTLKTQENY